MSVQGLKKPQLTGSTGLATLKEELESKIRKYACSGRIRNETYDMNKFIPKELSILEINGELGPKICDEKLFLFDNLIKLFAIITVIYIFMS